MENQAPSMFLDLVRKRHSCRAYNPEKPVHDGDLRACLEAARLAPSACNRQPWRFVVVRNQAKQEAILKEGLLPGIHHDWLANAPVIVALCVQKDITTHQLAPTVSKVPYYMVDAGIAGEHFILAATERGLGTCWIGWINQKKLKKLLALPRKVQVASLIAVGHPAETVEAANRTQRNTLAEIAFQDEYLRPLK
ncbi:MAG: nitroreductase family protein [Candidatus Pacebacteria bacterium]|nr:nitroreductase family protein [Candidatus Paceibacterota bacterium]